MSHTDYVGCGNTNPDVRCRMMRCDDCRKLNMGIVQEQGYRPIGRLNTSNPPAGGSAVPPMPETKKLNNNLIDVCPVEDDQNKILKNSLEFDAKEFKLWFTGFKNAVGSYPDINQWHILTNVIDNLRL